MAAMGLLKDSSEALQVKTQVKQLLSKELKTFNQFHGIEMRYCFNCKVCGCVNYYLYLQYSISKL